MSAPLFNICSPKEMDPIKASLHGTVIHVHPFSTEKWSNSENISMNPELCVFRINKSHPTSMMAINIASKITKSSWKSRIYIHSRNKTTNNFRVSKEKHLKFPNILRFSMSFHHFSPCSTTQTVDPMENRRCGGLQLCLCGPLDGGQCKGHGGFDHLNCLDGDLVGWWIWVNVMVNVMVNMKVPVWLMMVSE